MSLLFDATEIRRRKAKSRNTNRKHSEPRKRTPNIDSLVESIGELPVVVEIPIEYDMNDDIDIDNRHELVRFNVLAGEKLNAEDILRHINNAIGPWTIPFERIRIIVRTNDAAFKVLEEDVHWDTIDLAQCYIKFRYPELLLIRVAL